MEEQVYVKKRPRNKARVIVGLAIIIVAVAAYLLFARGGGKVADPAESLPQEVSIAATIDFTQSADRDAALDMIHSIFKDAGLDNPEGELYKEIKKNLNLDVEKDVLPHLSGKGGIAVLTELNGMVPGMVAVIGAKSDGDAGELIETLTAKLKENSIGYDKQKPYKGCEYYRIAGSAPAPGTPFGGPQLLNYVGAVKSSVVWASSEGAFRKAVDTANGSAPSLAQSAEFSSLRKETTDATFATVYFSGAGYYKLVGPVLNMAMGASGGELTPEMKEQLEGTTAVCTAEATGEGLKIAAFSSTKKAGPELANASLDEMAGEAPVDAKVAIVVNDWGKMWAEIEKQIFANPMLKGQIAQTLDQAKVMLGFDVQADLLDRFTSLSAYFVPRKPAKPQDFPGTITLVATVDKPEVVKASVAKLGAFISKADGKPSATVKAAGEDVWVMKDNPALCIAMTGKKLVVSITGGDAARTMTTSIKVAQGKGSTLGDTDGYKMVRSKLPDSGQGLVYGDIGGIFDTFKSEMPEPDRKKAEAVLQHVGWLAATGESKGTESSGIFVIPFKK